MKNKAILHLLLFKHYVTILARQIKAKFAEQPNPHHPEDSDRGASGIEPEGIVIHRKVERDARQDRRNKGIKPTDRHKAQRPPRECEPVNPHSTGRKGNKSND